MGHHLAQARQVEHREVVGAGCLPTVCVEAASAEAGQVAVGGPDRQADQQGEQGLEVVPLRFAGGQGGQYSGSRSTEHLLEWGFVKEHTIAGAVLPPPFASAGGRHLHRCFRKPKYGN